MTTIHALTRLPSAFAFATLLASCSMISGRETAGEHVDDLSITSRVKIDILGDPALSILQINVETVQGVVRLSGLVNSQRNEARAIRIASYVHGVKFVQDDLIVQ